MSDDPAAGHSEIVIVRRRGGDDMAAGKGGAWKIAYADFVTAMMAFFLVMWLINASNEETRAQVASYFNPIKLTDTSTGARGLKDKKESKSTQTGESSEGTPPSKADVAHEAAIMADPAKTIERIVAESGQKAVDVPVEQQTAVGATPANEPQSLSITDPFDPSSAKVPPAAKPQAAPEPPQKANPAPAGGAASAGDVTASKPAAKPDEEIKAKTEAPSPAAAGKNAEASTQTSAKSSGAAKAEPPTDSQLKEREAQAAKIAADIAARLGTGLDKLPESVEVKVTDEGTLISLTDRQSFGMFKTGSAEPEPQLVKLVEAIAGVLSDKPGYIVIRGHTDSRPYRNKRYDNWQLSTARAHLAQYMLIQGGLDESRIRRIEGLADRDPRNTEDPQAPENRRIEILLGLRVK